MRNYIAYGFVFCRRCHLLYLFFMVLRVVRDLLKKKKTVYPNVFILFKDVFIRYVRQHTTDQFLIWTRIP